MECYKIPTRLPYDRYYSPVVVSLAISPIFGLEVTVRFGIFKPGLDPGLTMIGDRVVRRSTRAP